jgi:hypothetical protein
VRNSDIFLIFVQHIQLKVSLEMDKCQKQNIISYLKTVYQGVPLKKLFKRCQHQLELCEKSLRESEFAGPLAIGKGNFRKSHGTFVFREIVLPKFTLLQRYNHAVPFRPFGLHWKLNNPVNRLLMRVIANENMVQLVFM